MNAKLLLGIVVIAGGLGLGWYVMQGKPTAPPTQPASASTQEVTAAPSPEDTSTASSGAIIAKVTVNYTDSGYTPNTITLKKGVTVRFVNQSTSTMWVASDVHPTHQLLPGFDELASVTNGGAYEYTFVKVGTWTYHNHMNPTDKGTVVVTE